MKIFKIFIPLLIIALVFSCASCSRGEEDVSEPVKESTVKNVKGEKWFDNYRLADYEKEKYEKTVTHPEKENVTLSMEEKGLVITVDGAEAAALEKTVVSVHFADLNGDSVSEICATYEQQVRGLPETDFAYLPAYDLWVYDVAHSAVFAPIARGEEDRFDRLFKMQGDNLYLIKYDAYTVSENSFTITVPAISGTEVVGKAGKIGYKTAAELCGYPFTVTGCVYFYKTLEGQSYIERYYLLTDEEAASLNKFISEAEWTALESAPTQFAGFVYTAEGTVKFGSTIADGANKTPSNQKDMNKFFKGLQSKSLSYSKQS